MFEGVLENTLDANIAWLEYTSIACRYVVHNDVWMMHLHPTLELPQPMHRPDINLSNGLLRLQKTKLFFLLREIWGDDVINEIMHSLLC